MKGERVEIDETTVGLVGGVRIPMGNMTRGADGWICSLALPNQTGVFVGVGSVVEIGGRPWEVVAIAKTPGQNGSVTLESRA